MFWSIFIFFVWLVGFAILYDWVDDGGCLMIVADDNGCVGCRGFVREMTVLKKWIFY